MRTLGRACGLPASLAAALAACSGEGSRSPTCGLALVAGPALIQQQLVNVPYVLTEAPRGLPGSLPARVIGVPQQGEKLRHPQVVRALRHCRRTVGTRPGGGNELLGGML